MREIKFRVWDKFNKKFIETEVYIRTDKDIVLINKKNNKWNLLPIAHVVISQYTGLKDKNGKEIYEGDIVESYFIEDIETNERVLRIGLVHWVEGEAAFAINWGNNRTFGFFSISACSVIGNKFENLELLENLNVS